VLVVHKCQQIQHSVLVNHSKNVVHVHHPDSREEPSALQLVLYVSHEHVDNEWGQCVAHYCAKCLLVVGSSELELCLLHAPLCHLCGG
jgi:hypothetical protein